MFPRSEPQFIIEINDILRPIRRYRHKISPKDAEGKLKLLRLYTCLSTPKIQSPMNDARPARVETTSEYLKNWLVRVF